MLIFISWIAYTTLAYPLVTQCGYRSDLTFFHEDSNSLLDSIVESAAQKDTTTAIWFIATITTFHIWDAATLLLYCWKIWRFGKIYKSTENGVWTKVLVILQRIFIITVFYSVCGVILLLWMAMILAMAFMETGDAVIWLLRDNVIPVLVHVLWSFSMYLMMEHNTTAYVRFLLIIRRFKLDYLCFGLCCFHGMIDRQLEAFQTSKVLALHSRSPTPTNKLTKRTSSTNTAKYVVKELNEHSLDTVTRVEGNDCDI